MRQSQKEIRCTGINGDLVIVRYDDASAAIEHLWLLVEGNVIDALAAALVTKVINGAAMSELAGLVNFDLGD